MSTISAYTLFRAITSITPAAGDIRYDSPAINSVLFERAERGTRLMATDRNRIVRCNLHTLNFLDSVSEDVQCLVPIKQLEVIPRMFDKDSRDIQVEADDTSITFSDVSGSITIPYTNWKGQAVKWPTVTYAGNVNDNLFGWETSPELEFMVYRKELVDAANEVYKGLRQYGMKTGKSTPIRLSFRKFGLTVWGRHVDVESDNDYDVRPISIPVSNYSVAEEFDIVFQYRYLLDSFKGLGRVGDRFPMMLSKADSLGVMLLQDNRDVPSYSSLLMPVRI